MPERGEENLRDAPRRESIPNLEAVQARLRQIERRDWWLWATAIVVMLLLGVAVIIFSAPALSDDEDPISQYRLEQAVQGLVGLVLLFSLHIIYQQTVVKRLRRRLSGQIEVIARQEIDAANLRELALVEPLTHLYNRHFLEQHLEMEIARARRQDYPLAVVMFDLNEFKKINDQHGHAVGDLALRQFAARLKKAIRNSDLPVRLGGDEFIVLLPECNPEHVPRVLSRVRGLEIEVEGQKFPVTFSAGWTLCRPDDTPDQLMERVDQALLSDKRTGKTEVQVSRIQDEARQSEKMRVVGRLAGGVAHDFNNLLTVIRGYSELILTRIGKSDPLRASVEAIQTAADRAAALTQQLLALSRKQILKPQIVGLNTVVADVDKMLRRLIGEHIERVTLFKATLGRVKADPGQMEQIIMNLAVNARDAMPQGGKLTVETANVTLAKPLSRPHATVNSGPYVTLSVSDTGTGIDQETLDHIFEPFFTTKGSGKGTGLGLATVYGVVRQSGGSIIVESEFGKGTTFTIYLPRVDEEADTPDGEKPDAEPPQGSETVLIVEDEMSVRRLTHQFLEGNGYHVLEAIEGREAMRVSEHYGGPIHLLLTDVVMPGMSGCELVKTLAPLRPEMKVLHMSGYTDDAITGHGNLGRGSTFLQKPFTLDCLARKVRGALDAGDIRPVTKPAKSKPN